MNTPNIGDVVRVKKGCGNLFPGRDTLSCYEGCVGTVTRRSDIGYSAKSLYFTKAIHEYAGRFEYVEFDQMNVILCMMHDEIELPEEAIQYLPVLEKPKGCAMDKFVIADANLSVCEFLTKYEKPNSVCFYRGKKSKFPAMEVSGDYLLTGTLEVTIFDNSVVYIRQS